MKNFITLTFDLLLKIKSVSARNYYMCITFEKLELKLSYFICVYLVGRAFQINNKVLP